jgi:hypothetical protein
VKKDAILVGPFSPTHSERKDLAIWEYSKNPGLQICNDYLKPAELVVLASSYKYIACPRGNGTDTHRFWESLYRGSIPVVKESRWSNSIKAMGVPILELQEWSFEEFLEKKGAFANVVVSPRDTPILWLDYWKKKFRIQS